jgi:hypothetical protein
MRRWIKLGSVPLCFGLLAGLAGCGSGGGDPASAAQPTPVAAVVAAPTPTSTQSPTTTPSAAVQNTATQASTPAATTGSPTPASNSLNSGSVSNANIEFADGFSLKNASCSNPVLISTNGQLANATWVRCTTSGVALSVAVDLIQNKVTLKYGDSIVGQQEFESSTGVMFAPITATSNRIVFSNVVLSLQTAKAFAGLGGALPIVPTTVTVSGDLSLQ